jgi:hypothetical protein
MGENVPALVKMLLVECLIVFQSTARAAGVYQKTISRKAKKVRLTDRSGGRIVAKKNPSLV